MDRTFIKNVPVVEQQGGAAPNQYITIEQDAAGFWACVSGTNGDGLYSESDDLGPFSTEATAEQAGRDYIIEYEAAE